jgi:single-strand DNA-binding protein
VAKTVNSVTLLGNIGKDPEVKALASGTKVATFSVATANRYKHNDEWVEQTEWHNCVAWAGLADIIGKYVKKGGKLYLEGRLQTRSWDNKETGKKEYRTEIVVSDVTLLGAPTGKRESSDDRDYTQGYVPGTPANSEAINDDDIPF